MKPEPVNTYVHIGCDFIDAFRIRHTSIQIVDKRTRTSVGGVDFKGESPWRVYADPAYRTNSPSTHASLVRLGLRYRARSIPADYATSVDRMTAAILNLP